MQLVNFPIAQSLERYQHESPQKNATMPKFLFIIIAFLFIPNLYGQNKPNTILWEVTSNKSGLKSYLFGTLHEVDTAFFRTLTNSMDKLKTSEIVFVEEINSSSDTSNLFKKLSLWKKQKWDSLLSTDQKLTFEKFIVKAERNDFYNLPPLILSRTIVGIYFTEFCQSSNSYFNNSLDAKIEQLGNEFKKPVFSLDKKQTDILKSNSLSIDTKLNLKYAESTIEFMSKMLNDDFNACSLITKYKSFDIDYQLNLDLTKLENHSPLLIDRNNKWIKILNKSLKEHHCFIAVGFRHLFYKQGLIQQLRALGYTVRPITP